MAAWSVGDEVRGLEYAAPGTASLRDITSTICALPTYLVQFYVPDSSGMTSASLHDDYWNSATFPDITPPACRSDFLGPASGSYAAPDAGPSKDTVSIDATRMALLLAHGNAKLQAVVVPTSNGSESMLVAQRGSVTFWDYDATQHTVKKVGRSTYPYAPKALGPPGAVGGGTVLDGMDHATFILNGAFSGDGSGNAVAYTVGAYGWGAIKAEQNGNLAPSGEGVGVSAIGLSQAFDFVDGQLETADCASSIPISECGGKNRILKFWRWTGTEFELARTGGLGS
jgi:hypothetical protein